MTISVPLVSKKAENYQNMTLWELAHQIFDATNVMCSADPRHGRYLTASAFFRGKISAKEVDE